MNLFEIAYRKCQLSHHKYEVSLGYLQWLFKDIDFKDKTVLDVGGGRGLYSYYAKFMGAKRVINLDPFSDGSSGAFLDHTDLEVIHDNSYFQDYSVDEKFDIIIMHDSINHLDEPMYLKLPYDAEAVKIYRELILKINNLLNHKGILSISDCSDNNFFNLLSIKNPFAPSIEWDLHKSPEVLISLIGSKTLRFKKLRWTPFKRFGFIGRLISRFGRIPSFFMQSHYNILFEKEDE